MKNKFFKFFTPILLAAALCGCGSHSSVSDVSEPIFATGEPATQTAVEPSKPNAAPELPTVHNDDVKTDVSSLLNMNTSLVDNVSHEHPNDNIMISGISLDYALAMLANGADPSVLPALEKFLGMSVNKANEKFGELLNRSHADSLNKLVISNSFWVKKDLPYGVKKDFTDILEKIYKAEIARIPMNESGISQINQWADKATDGLIKKALSPNDITDDTISILVNAILLDGKWASPFKSPDTHDVTFTHTDGSTSTVSGMHSEEYFYYENDHATAFRKDYQNQEFYMVGVLPKEAGEFDLTDLDLQGLLSSGKSTSELNADLHIMLPKVDFEMKYDLTNLLQDMGLAPIFDEKNNNFSGIYDNNEPDFGSYASKIIQNDRLIIDETGTKAAAVTSIIVDECCAIAPMERTQLYVYLERPFAVLLMDGETDEPLFIAKIVNP